MGKKLVYEGELYSAPTTQMDLAPILTAATKHMHEVLFESKTINVETIGKWHLYLDVGQSWLYEVDTRSPDARLITRGSEIEPFLRFRLDYSLLIMLLTRHANWVNAEIGSHISYFRAPDIHEKELSMSIGFLHL